jgi:hypothetical protein
MSGYNLISSNQYILQGETFTLTATFENNVYARIKDNYDNTIIRTINPNGVTTSDSVQISIISSRPNGSYSFTLETSPEDNGIFVLRSTTIITIWNNTLITSRTQLADTESFTLSATFNPLFDARIIVTNTGNFSSEIDLTDYSEDYSEDYITINSLGNISILVPVTSDNYPNGTYTFTLETKAINSDNWVSTQQSVSVSGWISSLTTNSSNIQGGTSFILTVTFNPLLDARIIDDDYNITNLTIIPAGNVTVISSAGKTVTVSFDTSSASIRVSTYILQTKPTNSDDWINTRQSVTITVWANSFNISSSNVELGNAFTLSASFNPLYNTRIIDNLNNIINLDIDPLVPQSGTAYIETSSSNYPIGSYTFTLQYNQPNSTTWVTLGQPVTVFVFSVAITILNKYNQPIQYIQINEEFFINFTFSPSAPQNVTARIRTDFSVIANVSTLTTSNTEIIYTGYSEEITSVGEYILTLEISSDNINWLNIGESISLFLFSISFTISEYSEDYTFRLGEPITLSLTLDPDYFIPDLHFRVINQLNNQLIYWESFNLTDLITEITVPTGIGQSISTVGPYTFSLQMRPATIGASTNDWKDTGQQEIVYVWINSLVASTTTIEFGQSFTLTATFRPFYYTRVKITNNYNNIIRYSIYSYSPSLINIAKTITILQTRIGEDISSIGTYTLMMQSSTDNNSWIDEQISLTVLVSSTIIITISNETSFYNTFISGYFIGDNSLYSQTPIQFSTGSLELILEVPVSHPDEKINYEITLSNTLKFNTLRIEDDIDVINSVIYTTISSRQGEITPEYDDSTGYFIDIKINLDIIPITQIITSNDEILTETVTKSVFSLVEEGLSLCQIEFLKNEKLSTILNNIERLRSYSRFTGSSTINNNGSLNTAGARYTENFPSAKFANSVSINELLLNKKNYMFSNSLNKNVVSGPIIYTQASSSGLTKAKQFANAARGRAPSGGIGRRLGVQYYDGRNLVSISNIYNRSNQTSQNINICNL